MEDKNEKIIGELHARLMKEFMTLISESISTIHEPIVENKPVVFKYDSGPDSEIKEIAAPLQEHSGPDKLNEIRSELAATPSAEILDPDEQSELMEIVKQKSDAFDRELRRMLSNTTAVESAAEKFKAELMDNVRNLLTEKKYALTGRQNRS
jgi:hypothetical protein